MSTADVVWRPGPELLRDSNVARFAAAHGLPSFDALLQRSIDDPEWFWDAVVQFLGLRFASPYDRVLDTSDGVPFAKWFTGGTLNIAASCLDRWADDPTTAADPAVVWEGEEGATRTMSWTELRALTARVAAGLQARGV